LRRVINEFADARPLVVFGDKKIFVRQFARTFDRSCQDICCHKFNGKLEFLPKVYHENFSLQETKTPHAASQNCRAKGVKNEKTI